MLVRLADQLTLLDLTVALHAPMVVVTSLGLGSLNAAELTVREAQRRGIDVAGLIGGRLTHNPDLATLCTIEALADITGVPLLGCLPDGCAEGLPEQFQALAKRCLDLSYLQI